MIVEEDRVVVVMTTCTEDMITIVDVVTVLFGVISGIRAEPFPGMTGATRDEEEIEDVEDVGEDEELGGLKMLEMLVEFEPLELIGRLELLE